MERAKNAVDKLPDKASYTEVCTNLRKQQDEEVNLSTAIQVRVACQIRTYTHMRTRRQQRTDARARARAVLLLWVPRKCPGSRTALQGGVGARAADGPAQPWLQRPAQRVQGAAAAT